MAVTFLHAYTFRRHEEQAGALCREIGFEQVSLSSEVMPMVKAVPRGLTSCADAYLTPSIQRYLTTFRVGFDPETKQTIISGMGELHLQARALHAPYLCRGGERCASDLYGGGARCASDLYGGGERRRTLKTDVSQVHLRCV